MTPLDTGYELVHVEANRTREPHDVRLMKSTVFARPNLKMILLGAILLLVVQHFIANGHSQATAIQPALVNAREGVTDELGILLKAAAEKPSAQIYRRISAGYERRGEYRKAVQFLRRAEKLAQMQGTD